MDKKLNLSLKDKKQTVLIQDDGQLTEITVFDSRLKGWQPNQTMTKDEKMAALEAAVMIYSSLENLVKNDIGMDFESFLEELKSSDSEGKEKDGEKENV